MGRNFTFTKVKTRSTTCQSSCKTTSDPCIQRWAQLLKDVRLGRQETKTQEVQRQRFSFQDRDYLRLLHSRGIFDKRTAFYHWSPNLYYIVHREGFKYVVRNARNEVFRTMYQPCPLRAVTQAEHNTHLQPNPRSSIRQQLRHATTQCRWQHLLRQTRCPTSTKTSHRTTPK